MTPFGVGDLIAGRIKEHKDRRGYIIGIQLVNSNRRFTIRWDNNVESIATSRGISLLLSAAQIQAQGVNPLVLNPPNPPPPPEDPLALEDISSDSDPESDEG